MWGRYRSSTRRATRRPIPRGSAPAMRATPLGTRCGKEAARHWGEPHSQRSSAVHVDAWVTGNRPSVACARTHSDSTRGRGSCRTHRPRKCLQIGDSVIGNSIGVASCATTISSVYPYTGDAEVIGWSNVVVQALRNVQPLFRFNCHPRSGDVEIAHIGFVASDLLSSDDGIEVDVERLSRPGEQIVVHVGDDRELVACLQRVQRGRDIREDRPFGQGVREAVQLRSVHRKPSSLPICPITPRKTRRYSM